MKTDYHKPVKQNGKMAKSKISHQANQWYKKESSKLSKLQKINKRNKITKREKYVVQLCNLKSFIY